MSLPGLTSGVGWERDLIRFLRQELAPTPARWRASLRLTGATALAIALIMTLHIPDGEFLLVTFFVVSQSDAWASLQKARLRVIGTLLGGLAGIAYLTAFADKPWLGIPAQGAVVAATLFLSRTVSAPYAALLAGLTFVMVVPEFSAEPSASIERALWRIGLTAAGALLGTAVQLFVWPDDPEELLLADLEKNLRFVEQILARARSGARDGLPGPDSGALAITSMARALDLLGNAEARHRTLRLRHAEQAKVVSEIELLVIDTIRVGHRAGAGRTPSAGWLEGLERRLGAAREATAALRTSALRDHELGPAGPPPHRLPFFTDAFRVHNGPSVRFALKGALAAMLCGLFYDALDWPGIATCVITVVVTAQGSFGGSLRKSAMRLAGAALAGLVGLLVVVGFVPNIETLASFLAVTLPLFFVAAWLTSGSSRISYVGLQFAIALSLVLLNQIAPSTSLIAATDRVIGILVGCGVMTLVSVTLWPDFAVDSIGPKLARVLRDLAGLVRSVRIGDRNAARDAVLIAHREMAEVLTLCDDLVAEAASRVAVAEAEGPRRLRFVSALQDVFLVGLARERHLATLGAEADAVALPPEAAAEVARVDAEVEARLEALAVAVERPGPPVPSAFPSSLLSDMEHVVVSESIALRRERSLHRDLVTALDRLETILAEPAAGAVAL